MQISEAIKIVCDLASQRLNSGVKLRPDQREEADTALKLLESIEDEYGAGLDRDYEEIVAEIMNKDVPNDEPPEPEEPLLYHNVEGNTQANGSILAMITTNDNEDRGHTSYPDNFAAWTTRHKNRESFIKTHGISRIGIAGIKVTVTLDGEEIKE